MRMRPITLLLIASLALLTQSVNALPEERQALTSSYVRETLVRRLTAKGFVCSPNMSVTADDEPGTKLDFTNCTLNGLKVAQNCHSEINSRVLMFNLGSPRLLKIDAVGCARKETLDRLVEPAIRGFDSYLAPAQ
jgi:hypothetical protein